MSIEENDKDLEFLKNLSSYESQVPGGLWDDINKGIEKFNAEHSDLEKIYPLKNHRSIVPDNSWNVIARGLARIAFRRWAFYSVALLLLIAGGIVFFNTDFKDSVSAEATRSKKQNNTAPHLKDKENAYSPSANNGDLTDKGIENNAKTLQKTEIAANTEFAAPKKENTPFAERTPATLNGKKDHAVILPSTNIKPATAEQQNAEIIANNDKSSLKNDLFLNKRNLKQTLPFFNLDNVRSDLNVWCCQFKPKKPAGKKMEYRIYAGGDGALNIPHIGFNFKYENYWWPGLQEALKEMAQRTSSFNPSAGVQIVAGKNLFGIGLMLGEIRLKINGNFVTNELPNYNSEGAITSISRYSGYYTFNIDAQVNIDNVSLPLNYYRNVLGKKNKFYVGAGIVPNYTFAAKGSFLQGGSSTEYIDGRGILRKFNADYTAGILYQKVLSKHLFLQGQMAVSKNIINMFAPDYKQSATIGFWKPTAGLKLVYSLH